MGMTAMNTRKNCGLALDVARVGGIALGGLLGTTILCSTAPALAADESDMLDVSSLERITDGSLDDLRGGFSIGGFSFSFGITITTTVNGQTVLQTVMNVDSAHDIQQLVQNQVQTQLAGLNGNGNDDDDVDVEVSISAPEYADVDVDVDVDDGGEDIDVDVDVDFDSKSEIKQAIAQDQAAANTQLASAGGALDFQVASASPLPSEVASEAEPVEPAEIDMSGIVTPTAAEATETPASTNTVSWTLTELPNGEGWQAVSSDLATTIVHQIGHGITASVATSGSGQSIQTAAEMNLVFENFSDMQMQAMQSHVLTNLMVDMTNHAALGN
jgi:hypothetical protein